jgi:hypothetical protein
MKKLSGKKYKMVIAILLTFINIGYVVVSLKEATAQPILIALPEFKHCTCDSGTYCLTDDDVMKLHKWHENVKHLENRRLSFVE